MSQYRRLGAALTAAVALALSLTIAPAGATVAATSSAPAASADAYALDVDVVLTPLDVEVDEGPFARASQDYPPQVAEPAEAEVLQAGPIPANGSVVDNVGVMSSIAGANSQPLAVAASQAVDVALLNQSGDPLITADVLMAQSTTDCTNAPSAAGTQFVGLEVAGTAISETPEPNTAVADAVFNPLGLRVILNEQHPTADGRGLVVNAIHVYNIAEPTVPGLFRGDIVVAHAMSTVNCPNGAPTTGADNDVFITKSASKSTAKRGDTITYSATVQNKSDEPCLVNTFIDHLPSAFEYQSTSGMFGTVATTVARTGGGQDVVIKPTDMTIAANGSATQTFVVKVKDDAAFATYFNNVEIFCSNLGNWVKGLDAPVTVVGDQPVTPPKVPLPDDALPRTGLPGVLGGIAAALVVGALLLRRGLNARP